MKSLLLIASLGLSHAAMATPFLVSDPWPATVEQPTECVYQEGTQTAVVAPVVTSTNGVSCRFDLAGITRTAHSYQVCARNLWGDSPKVPFDFAASTPSGPGGLRVSP